ncbi:Uncharacterised protein [Streptococcus pneumoniae]|nr:Uncharacterised protein [Streptococcus pneumoniae]
MITLLNNFHFFHDQFSFFIILFKFFVIWNKLSHIFKYSIVNTVYSNSWNLL